MGCDIHVAIEKKSNFGWTLATVPQPSPYWMYHIPEEYLGEAIQKVDDYIQANHAASAWAQNLVLPTNMDEFGAFLRDQLPGDDGSIIFGEEPWFNWTLGTPDIYHARNYNFFAILANVRNNGQITPISGERGLPINVSPEAKAAYEEWGADAHSPSHVTYSELLTYSWDDPLKVKCYVDESEYVLIRNGRSTGQPYKPKKYSGYAGSGIERTEAEMDDIIAGRKPRESARYIVKTSFDHPVRDAVGSEFLAKIFYDLATYGNPDDVRLVFWFDN